MNRRHLSLAVRQRGLADPAEDGGYGGVPLLHYCNTAPPPSSSAPVYPPALAVSCTCFAFGASWTHEALASRAPDWRLALGG